MRRGFIVSETPEEGTRRTLIVSSVIIGRSADCDVAISDSAASRHHVEVQATDEGFVWKDLGSTNGTLINGRQVQSGELKDGDRLRIGETELVFELEEIVATGESEESTLFKTLMDAEGQALARSSMDARSEELLRAIYTVMNEVATNYDHCTLIDKILETCTRAIDAQRIAILFAGVDGEELRPCPTCSTFHMIQNGRLRRVNREGVHISSTVAHRVMSRGESVLYQDAQSSGDLNNAESIVSLNLRSIMCVPMRGKSVIHGLVYVDSDRPNQPYTREDMLLVTAVGNTAGLALENANIHSQLIEKERTDQEIKHAWAIQESFLIRDWSQDDSRYEVFGETRPAKTVGGDFYDFVQPDENHVGILVGDVSGKGVPAALTMAQVLAEFRLCARQMDDPVSVLAALNAEMFRRSRFGMFCTMTFITLDLTSGELRCANAGHHPGLCVSPGDSRLFGEATGPPIGVVADSPWEEELTTLKPGETVVLYTDGIVEARGLHTHRGAGRPSDEFGLRNLSRVAQGLCCEGPKEIITGVNLSVQEYTAPALPHDDCTMIALRYHGLAE